MAIGTTLGIAARNTESLKPEIGDISSEITDIIITSGKIKIKPKATIVKEQSIVGDAIIWGNPDFGIWNSQKWGNQSTIFIFILGHPIFGILGTSTLGNPEFSEYKIIRVTSPSSGFYEKFIDTSFCDTDVTTATWGTNGELNFTNGQIAQSIPIEYNNDTITQAKLTATVSSGDFKYYMTADGTNWEEVSNGVLHTFTNTGKNLKFKIVENGGSTGKITQVVVSDFK